VVQGEPRAIELRLPSGYELTGITGSSVEASEPVDRQVKLTLADPAARRHQLLVTLERSHPDGSFNFDTAFVEVADVERERGEVAVEGVGTLDLVAAERGGMHRIDVKELNTSLQALARTPLLSGFRYQRTAAESPALALAVTRFADSSVLAAMVDRAVATTLITSEGRALTEVTLSVRNRAQSFLKVTLPGGATIVSVTVAGQPAKPVLGDDGSRVPLLRPGFRPAGPYEVSFVYLHAGAPFLRSGDLTMTLPHMDIPVGVVEWEVFAPDNYSLRFVDGNAITQQALDRAVGKAVGPHAAPISAPASLLDGVGSSGGIRISLAPGEGAGRIRGVVKDASGAVLPGVTVTITSRTGTPFSATSASDGTFLITGVQPGIARINASIPGFQTAAASFVVGDIGHRMEITMNVGSLAETVSVSGQSPRIDRHPEEQKVEPSQNVINLQRRVQGVLPIRVEVPRAGTSYRFSRPLVVDDETRVAFHYKRK
jgi:hypothetical protein